MRRAMLASVDGLRAALRPGSYQREAPEVAPRRGAPTAVLARPTIAATAARAGVVAFAVVGATTSVFAQTAPAASVGSVQPRATPEATSSTTSVTQTPSDARAAPALADHKAQLNAFRLRIEALRSRVGGVEARVDGLKQTVLVGAVLATRARLIHKNEMSGNFELERAVYRLDGDVIFSQTADEGLSDSKEIMLFDGPLLSGAHAVDVELVFRGAALGVFTYLQGYKFNVRSRYQLDVVEGRNTVLRIVAYEADDITSDAKERFKVRYDVEINDEALQPVSKK